MTMHRFNVGNDGALEEAESKEDATAREVISLVTSTGAATNRTHPVSGFTAGRNVLRVSAEIGAAAAMGVDSFTRGIMAASKPVAAKSGFDKRGMPDWV
jgi:hypothetical protein